MSTPSERTHLRSVGAQPPALLSPSEAAQRVRVSRRTIMRVISTKELEAFRDNQNHWKIKPEDVDKWAGAQCAPTEQPTPLPSSVPMVSPTARPDDPDEKGRGAWQEERLALTVRAVTAEGRVESLGAKVEMLEARLTEQAGTFEERLSELRGDRDHWRGLAERLTRPEPEAEPIEPEPEPEVVVEPVLQRPWWGRLLKWR